MINHYFKEIVFSFSGANIPPTMEVDDKQVGGTHGRSAGQPGAAEVHVV